MPHAMPHAMPPIEQAQRYIGRPYADDYDCVDLAADVLREVFGRTVALPSRRHGAAGRQVAMRRLQALQCAPVAGEPADGDIAVFRAQEGWHVGVVLTSSQGIQVLHNSEQAGGVWLWPLHMFAARAMSLEGVYRVGH